MKSTRLTMMLATVLAALCAPGDSAHAGIALKSADGSDADLTINGFGSLQCGQIMLGRQQEDTLKHFWLENAYVNITLDATYRKNLRIGLGIEGKESFDQIYIAQMKGPWYVAEKYFQYYFSKAEGSYTLGNIDATHVQFGAGVFPLKYNPDARNLGEYLFRTGTYPGFIVTQFDMPFARLSGLRVGGAFRDLLQADLLLTSESDHRPFFDWSLSFVGSARMPNKFLEIGAGVTFDRLLSVNSQFTTPQTLQNAVVNPKDSTDTIYYSFAGIKPMVRFCVNPQAFFKSSLFGANDLKLYGEAAILGIKNYPALYDTMSQRIPVMLGFNFPAFKVLDVLSFELEWYGCHYADSYDQAQRNGSPRPDYAQNMQQHDLFDFLSEDEMKWSVYARKTVLEHVALVAQLARDHSRLDTQFEEHRDRVEAFVNKRHWYWMIKAQFDL